MSRNVGTGTTEIVPLSMDPTIAQRRAEVLELRRKGWPFRQIGEELGISCGRAHDDYVIALKAMVPVEDIEHMRRLDADRLDHGIVLATRLLEKEDAPVALRLQAIDKLILLQARRSKLLGLDAPTQVEHSGTVTVVTPSRVAQMRDELEERRQAKAS